MKLKLLFSLFALTCVLTSQAQIEKGSLLLGSSIGYSQGKTKVEQATAVSSKNNTFSFSPSIGVALKENLVAGVRFDYLKNTSKYTYDANNAQNGEIKNYGGGIFIRRYVPVVNRLYVFGEGTAFYKTIKQTSTQTYYNSKTEIKNKGWGTGLSITPGISFGVSKKFQIEGGFNSLLNVSYAKSKITGNTTATQKAESFSGGIGNDDESMFYVGFRFIL